MKIDYSIIFETYDHHRSYAHSEIVQLIRFGEIESNSKILDLGCGTGNLSEQLLECIPVDIIGIDKSLQMLNKARKKSLQVLCGDAGHVSLPLKDNSFDLVIGAFVIHHIKNRMALIRECFRILNDGALIILTSSHRQIENLHPVLNDFFPSLVEIDKRRFPKLTELDNSFQNAGFKRIKHGELIINRIPIDMDYLDKVKSKYVSTFHLLSDDEFKAGVEKLETFIKTNKETAYREWRGTMIYGKKH
jgi:SAM-dependent methyltransferase